MPKYKIINSAGIAASVGLLAVPAFLTLSPVMLDSSEVSATPAETTTTLNAASVLGLTATDVSINITPDSSQSVFGIGTSKIDVNTNNESGYTLTMTSGSENSLVHANKPENKISSISDQKTGTNFGSNEWGYNFTSAGSSVPVNATAGESLTYNPIPTDSILESDKSVGEIPEYTGESTIATLKRTKEPSTDKTYLTYGVKIAPSLMSGKYQDKITLTAVPNYVAGNNDNPTFYTIRYMQEMTHDICQNTETPSAFRDGEINADVPEATLIDQRDGNAYTIRKLADGNCWMSQNLRIDRSSIVKYDTSNTMGKLSSSDSNLSSDATIPEVVDILQFPVTRDNSYITRDILNEGFLYNWHAAIALADNTSAIGHFPTTSICPRNWRLPDATGIYSYKNLVTDTYGISSAKDALTKKPLSYTDGGYAYGHKYDSTQGGYYWTRTAGNYYEGQWLAMTGFMFNIGQNSFNTGFIHSDMSAGYMIRCVAE